MILVLRSAFIAALVCLALVGIALHGGAQGRGPALDRPAPEIVGGPWINSEPLAPAALRGRVVLVDFWTYG
ncbi:MAG TPA: hypothetical protein VK548_20230 [Candidatus Acidoferrum sp.]|nr:hypothetical protein [Candidatus Acidoferrum sp.]